MLFNLSAQAQEKFSLDECVSLALKNSLLLKAEKAFETVKYHRAAAKAMVKSGVKC